MALAVKAKRWVLVNRFDGFPKEDDLRLEEEQLPPLKDGEFLVESLYLSVDPYMRAFSNLPDDGAQVGRAHSNLDLPVVNRTMIGGQVGRVVESKNKDAAVGAVVLNGGGWRTHTIFSDIVSGFDSFTKPRTCVLQPDIGDLQDSLRLGALGMPGMTAYNGFLEICQPKAGETVVVNSAAGAVGSIVGQIAKIKGCNVIGYAGTDEKIDWLTKDLGFDYAFNYKTCNLDETLTEAAPNGVDCYFDNVGGEFSNTVLSHMNQYGRVSICGCISSYHDKADNRPKGDYPYDLILFKELTVKGFVFISFGESLHGKAFNDMLEWIQSGKVKCREHVTEGFENMRDGFYNMLKGGNIGKAVIKV